MVKGLYTAYTGMLNEQNRMDIMTNNLANADTNGYKKEGSTAQTFADTYAIKIKDTSAYNIPRRIGDISPALSFSHRNVSKLSAFAVRDRQSYKRY